MLEKTVEVRLRRLVRERLGGRAYKFESPGTAGMPDRLVCLPGGRVVFVETKQPGKTPRPLQKKRHAELRELGCEVWGCIDTSEKVDKFIVDVLRGGSHEV